MSTEYEIVLVVVKVRYLTLVTLYLANMCILEKT